MHSSQLGGMEHGRRQFIPLSTKFAVLKALGRGDKRRDILKRFGLKHYSNINRIVGQRDSVDQMFSQLHSTAEEEDKMNFRDDDDDGDGAQGNGEPNTLVMQELLADLKLQLAIGCSIVKALSNALPIIDAEVVNVETELDHITSMQEDTLDMEQEEEDEDDDEGGTEEEESSEEDNGDHEDDSGDENDNDFTSLKGKCKRLLLEIKIINNTIESLSSWQTKLLENAVKINKTLAGEHVAVGSTQDDVTTTGDDEDDDGISMRQ